MNLTVEEAFKAMVIFLERYYNETHSDDIGSLLSDLILLDDKQKAADPAAWTDWMRAIKLNKLITQNHQQHHKPNKLIRAAAAALLFLIGCATTAICSPAWTSICFPC
jgi:hypothetical protein